MAVIDSRQLIFDLEAIRASLSCDSYVARQLQLAPSDQDVVYLLPDDQSIEITQNDPSEEGAQAIIHRLTAMQVAALLIAYCIRSGIPVPRNCRKTINIRTEDIALLFEKRL